MDTQLISVKRSLDQIEHFERRVEQVERQFRAALESYLGLVESFNRHTLSIHPELEGEFRERLREVCRQAREDPAERVLAQTGSELDRHLEDHSRRSVAIFREKTNEVRRILLVLADATERVRAQTGSQSAEFRYIAQRLETVSRLEDLGEIRRVLTEHVETLNRNVDSMDRDSHRLIAQLQNEMDGIRQRLDHAQRQAEKDVLTGLLNRRGMERRLEEAVGADKIFSVILFDLNRFKAINDRHGHLCGDEVLKVFAARLAAEFRPEDAVARWGGDEFLALIPCSARDAMARSRLIAQRVCGAYAVKVSGREVRAEVSASTGVAEHRPGQTAQQIFAVADALMYQGKSVSG